MVVENLKMEVPSIMFQLKTILNRERMSSQTANKEDQTKIIALPPFESISFNKSNRKIIFFIF